jgi:hypothetical protein
MISLEHAFYFPSFYGEMPAMSSNIHIFGNCYTPVIVVSPLRATRFIHLQYPVYLSGVILLLSGFWWM